METTMQKSNIFGCPYESLPFGSDFYCLGWGVDNNRITQVQKMPKTNQKQGGAI